MVKTTPKTWVEFGKCSFKSEIMENISERMKVLQNLVEAYESRSDWTSANWVKERLFEIMSLKEEIGEMGERNE